MVSRIKQRLMGGKRITDAIRRDVIFAYEGGLTQKQVAAKCHIAEKTVFLVLRQANVRARDCNSYKMVPDSVQQLIVDAILQGENKATIANRYNVCVATVNIIRKRHHLPPRVRKASNEQRDRIVRLYESGIAGDAIAKQLGIHKTTTYNILRRSQVKLRGVRKWPFDEGFFRARNETTAYWMGFLMADGSLHKSTTNSHRLTLSLNADDLVHLQDFCLAIGLSPKAITKARRKGVNPESGRPYVALMATVVLNHTAFAKWLLPWGIVPRKTYRFVPPKIPKRLYPAFLRGWFDGDGCIHLPKRGQFLIVASIVAHEERAIRWYSEALRKIGYKGRVKPTQDCKGNWRLHIAQKRDVLRLADILRVARQPRLTRKWEEVLSRPRACFNTKEITPEMVQSWKRMYQDRGASTAEIAEETGFHASTINRRLKAEGVRIRGARVKTEDELLTLKMYGEGSSQDAIAKQIGISQATVSDILGRNGVKARPRGGSSTIQPETAKMMVAEYEASKSTLKVARLFGLSPAGAWKVLKRAGAILGRTHTAKVNVGINNGSKESD